MELAERIQPDVFGVAILCPYPGCDYEPEKMKDIDWEKTDEYSNGFWCTDHFSNSELKKWQKYLMGRFKDRLAWHHTIMNNFGMRKEEI